MNYRYSFIILSALLFTVPFFIPTLCILIFFFPAPLIYVMCAAPITFCESMLFGGIIWGIHLWAPCFALFTIAHGSLIARSILPVILIFYMILITALWLTISSNIIQYIHPSIALRYFACSSMLCIYFLWIEHCCLSIGQWDGYPFANPLIALAYYPQLVWLAASWGITLSLFLFFMFAGAITLVMHRPIRATILMLAMCSVLWLLGLAAYPAAKPPPAWITRIGHLPIMLTANNEQSMTESLTWHINILRARHPFIDLIILPESACCMPPDWNSFTNHPALLLGTFFNETNSRLNICFFWSKSVLKMHVKQHTIPIAEGIPLNGISAPFLSLFFKNALPTRRGTQKRPHFQKSDEITLVPFICSELFFSQSPDDKTDHPIVALCNDWWFPSGYFPRLMALTARLRAIAWHRPIVYVSYRYAQYFDEYGFGRSIATTPDLFFID